MRPGRESIFFPCLLLHGNCPWGTWASLTDDRRIWKAFFTGKGKAVLGHAPAAIALCARTLDRRQKCQIPSPFHVCSPSAPVQSPQVRSICVKVTKTNPSQMLRIPAEGILSTRVVRQRQPHLPDLKSLTQRTLIPRISTAHASTFSGGRRPSASGWLSPCHTARVWKGEGCT